MLTQYALFPAFVAVILLAGAMPALAAEARLIGSYGAWSAYEFTENGNKVCYMAARPDKMEGKYSKRGEVYALVTHRPAESSKDVFSYITGYAYKPESNPVLTVNGENFNLFTQDETAWAPDAATDSKIALALRKGSTMLVSGTSSRGTQTKDIFSLKGSGAAHDAINKACNAE